MIITISGTPGSGKSTIANILAEKLKFERIYVGGIRRDLAKSKNMTLEQLNKYALKNPETDVDVDKEAAKKAREFNSLKKDVIVEGRVHFHFIPESIKLYIDVDFEEGAKRIWKDMQNKKIKEKRNEDNINSFEEMKESLKKRIENDKQRYLKYYNIDCYDKNNYDLIIDTTNITPNEAVEQIISFMNSF
jgi:CMP/dCMP kinase